MSRARTSLALVLLLCASAAKAETSRPLGTLSLVVENDAVFSDRNYTSGLMLVFVSGDRRDPGPTRWLGEHLLFADEGDRIRFGVRAGQSLFTPEDTSVLTPLPNQHPYAGWLYGGLSLIVESDRTLDTLALELGTVGPNALGEEAQDFAHDGLGLEESDGWDNQVDNEFAGALHYDRKWRLFPDLDWAGLELDLIPNLGFSAGNRLTQANAGLTLRVGDDLGNDFGPLRVRPGLGGAGLLQTHDAFSAYLYFGLQGRAVAYDVVLDGNTDGKGARIGRRPLGADLQGGIVLQICALQAGVGVIWRSSEFRPQSEGDFFSSMFVSLQL